MLFLLARALTEFGLAGYTLFLSGQTWLVSVPLTLGLMCGCKSYPVVFVNVREDRHMSVRTGSSWRASKRFFAEFSSDGKVTTALPGSELRSARCLMVLFYST